VVLERRHVLGGAAVTEEVFPGFKFSVCSYVVSLLRPEIIRELDLPRHGMELLPLDGTLTPMPTAITCGVSTITTRPAAKSRVIRARCRSL
jgi:phytoene dehydrogenase-like protein